MSQGNVEIDEVARVLAGITISLDGYYTGPNDRRGAGLGDGGERLHYWVFGGPWTYEGERGARSDVDNAYIGEVFASGGAMICGRTMYDVIDGWGEEPGFGVPVLVVTRRAHERLVKGDTSFDFVTGGIQEALSRAREAAAGRDVIVMGGGELLGEYLAAGLVDEFTLTIAPVLLGAGKRLFDGIGRTDLTFERAEVIESPWATHVRYRVGPAAPGAA